MLNTKAGTGTEQCYDCKIEQPTGYCAISDIKDCGRRKGYEFCNECSEYSTSEQMRKFVEDTKWLYQQGVLKNMEMIRRDGVAKLVAWQEKRWQCANCGTPHSWRDKICPPCGQTVANFEANVL